MVEAVDVPVLFVPDPRPTKKPTTSTAASGALACKVHPRAVAPSRKHLVVSCETARLRVYIGDSHCERVKTCQSCSFKPKLLAYFPMISSCSSYFFAIAIINL